MEKNKTLDTFVSKTKGLGVFYSQQSSSLSDCGALSPLDIFMKYATQEQAKTLLKKWFATMFLGWEDIRLELVYFRKEVKEKDYKAILEHLIEVDSDCEQKLLNEALEVLEEVILVHIENIGYIYTTKEYLLSCGIELNVNTIELIYTELQKELAKRCNW